MDCFNFSKAIDDTRGCTNVIHFDNAGSSLMPKCVVETLQKTLEREEAVGGYLTQNELAEELEGFYVSAAKLLNCNPNEIAFMENNTRAWGLVLCSIPFQPGDKIITSLADYGSNIIAYLHLVKRYGVEIIFAPHDERSQINLQSLESLIDDRVKLISISYIPSGNGLINPARDIGKIAQKAGIPFLLDACQAVGQIPIDVVDF